MVFVWLLFWIVIEVKLPFSVYFWFHLMFWEHKGFLKGDNAFFIIASNEILLGNL